MLMIALLDLRIRTRSGSAAENAAVPPGLYYLYTNPLNLPVPQLRVSMQVELRLGRGGSKMDGKTREQVATGNIRAQGRLDGKMLVASPWSLDIPGHFEKLFGTVN